MENLKFFGISICIFAGLIALAALAEKFVRHSKKSLMSTHYITYTALFSCMAGILMLFEIPLFFAPVFYKLDLSEMPIFICTFYLGPVAGVIAELLKVLIKLLLKSTSSAFVGELANFVIGCSLILPASIIYHAKPSRRNALIGMAVGTVSLTVFGSLINALYLIPKFAQLYGMPLETIVAMGTEVNSGINSVSTLVLFAVVPFNLLKGVCVSTLTYLLYKRISPMLHKGDEKMISRRESRK